MHLDKLAAADHQRGPAHRVNGGPHGVHVQALAAHQELHVIAVAALVLRLKLRGLLPAVFEFGRTVKAQHIFAARQPQHPLQDIEQPLPARVHNARLLQHGQQVGRARQRVSAGGHHNFQQLGEVNHAVLIHSAHRGGGGLARDGEDRAFYRRRNGAVGGVNRVRDRVRKHQRVEHFTAAQRLGEAMPQLRQNNARVAARAQQSALGDRHAHDAHMWFLHHRDFSIGAAHRLEHVLAGVAVRDRKNIKLIHALMVAFQPGDAGGSKPLEQMSINHMLIQNNCHLL